MGAFKEPHGGELKQLYLAKDEVEQAKKAALDYQSWDLTDRQLCDIEMILNGAFSPLEGFHTQAEYEKYATKLRHENSFRQLWLILSEIQVKDKYSLWMRSRFENIFRNRRCDAVTRKNGLLPLSGATA